MTPMAALSTPLRLLRGSLAALASAALLAPGSANAGGTRTWTISDQAEFDKLSLIHI